MFLKEKDQTPSKGQSIILHLLLCAIRMLVNKQYHFSFRHCIQVRAEHKGMLASLGFSDSEHTG